MSHLLQTATSNAAQSSSHFAGCPTLSAAAISPMRRLISCRIKLASGPDGGASEPNTRLTAGISIGSCNSFGHEEAFAFFDSLIAPPPEHPHGGRRGRPVRYRLFGSYLTAPIAYTNSTSE